MVSAARRSGDFRVLYPKGVKRIDQVPWPLQEAISHALTILSWFENYTPEEIPAETLWDDAEAVEEHFNRVKLNKELERDGYQPDDDDEGGMLGNDMSSVFKE